MPASVPQPTFGRVLSILWFPFFLAVVMSALFVGPLAQPDPKGIQIAASGDVAALSGVRESLDASALRGVELRIMSLDGATAAVENDDVGAAILTGDDPAIIVSSAASATRAKFLTAELSDAFGYEVVDINPSIAGDSTGTGVFFYALPIAIVAMVSAIVLLQLGAWSYRKKMTAVLVIAAFTSVVTCLIAMKNQVLPFSSSSLFPTLGAFALVVAIGWTLTGAAAFVRQYFVPVALTFVLVLGVPTAGAPVSSDMLPPVLSWIHQVMPMAQFIAGVRAVAFDVGSPVQPAVVLMSWIVIGTILIAASACLETSRKRRRATRDETPEETRFASISGTVTSLSGAVVPHARIWLLDEKDETTLQTQADETGRYSFTSVREGTHRLIVTAPRTEPEIVTVVAHDDAEHDFAVQLWDDPAGNLLVDTVGER